MFENAKWIGMEHCHNAPWRGTVFVNEDCSRFLEMEEYRHREYGSILFRREFVVDLGIESASISICGLGYYDLYINGKRPDENRVLTPIVSNYFKYSRYDTYDISSMLDVGANVIAVEVCGGWFTGKDNFWGWQQIFYGNPRLTAQLDIKMSDGSTKTLITDTENWKVLHGAVEFSCIYNGETVDLNRVPVGWKQVGADTSGWLKPVEAQAPTENMLESIAPPVRITDKVKPIASWKLSETQTVYDFGTNSSGLPLLEAHGKCGDKITLNFSEYIFEDGKLNEISCQGGGATNTDTFTLTGDTDICQPRFTWHGYRYCMLTLSSPDIAVNSIEKCVIHSDVKTTGTFTCSDSELNRLHEAYVRTQLSCLMGIPVDCNQRGERLGWLGDACVTAEECLYNFDMREFYRSYLSDMKAEISASRKTVGYICPNHKHDDGTSIDWSMAYPVILMEYYRRYGDLSILKEHYEALARHTEFYINLYKDGSVPSTCLYPDGKERAICWFGDWFTLDFPNGTQKVAFSAGTDDHRQNPTFAGALFYVWLLRIISMIADLLGKKEDAEKYRSLREITVNALREKYYDSERHILGSGGQFLLTIALSEHIVPENERNTVFANLLYEFEKTDYHMVMGIFGVRLIADVLTSFGREDILFKLLNAKGYPSPLHMISEGQTTISEDLNGGGGTEWGSGCHCMFASPDTSFHRVLGGITVNRCEDVFIKIAPHCPRELTFVKASQAVTEGEIRSSWHRNGDSITFSFSIPVGCRAEVDLANGDNAVSGIYQSGEYTVTL